MLSEFNFHQVAELNIHDSLPNELTAKLGTGAEPRNLFERLAGG